uniref:Uncharacterized protein n=1 Tax=Meloidogyne enterolobii TaxID=390850 RepID=A0A6V7WQ65_MELEN|nr:unnamed protein product [Meloidogyne enterolobii]CAD2189162.1 unnamed protein product [Meloidogyne enterolobii]
MAGNGNRRQYTYIFSSHCFSFFKQFKIDQFYVQHDRQCNICKVTKSLNLYRHSEPGQYLCQSCYDRERK